MFTSFLQNKYAHLVNSIFLIDFPLQKWNTFFNDFLQRCDGKVKCDIFLKILIQINLDIADREIPRTQKVRIYFIHFNFKVIFVFIYRNYKGIH